MLDTQVGPVLLGRVAVAFIERLFSLLILFIIFYVGEVNSNGR
jgi:hypothetical protein